MRRSEVDRQEEQKSKCESNEEGSIHTVDPIRSLVLGKCKVMQIHFTSNPFGGAV